MDGVAEGADEYPDEKLIEAKGSDPQPLNIFEKLRSYDKKQDLF